MRGRDGPCKSRSTAGVGEPHRWRIRAPRPPPLLLGCSRFLPSSSSVCPGISSDPGRAVVWSLNPCPVLPQTRVRDDRRGSSWRLAHSERAPSLNKAGEGKQMLPGGACLSLTVSTARRPCVEVSSENEARGTNRQRRCRRDSVLWRILMKKYHRHPFK